MKRVLTRVMLIVSGAFALMGFPRTPPEIHARLYEQVEVIHRVCEAQEIKYWLIGGSLLGQVRGEMRSGKGEIIPWDNDADVGIFVEDRDKLFQALEMEAKKVGMLVHNSTHGIKLKCAKMVGVGTDIFTYKKEESGAHSSWVLASDASRKGWPLDFFLVDELKDLPLVNFGPLLVRIPVNPMRYLKTLYGPDCMEVGKLDFDHVENKKHEGAGVSIPLGNLTSDEVE